MSPAIFQTALYLSLALCALGLVWRVSAWFRLRIGPDAQALTLFERLAAVSRGTASALVSRSVFRVLAALVFDVLLQYRLFVQAKLRWFAHLLIVAGFTLLLLMHALAALLGDALFPGYQPTLAPYLFLRNLCGAMVFVGAALLLYARGRQQTDLAQTRRLSGAAFMALLGLVLASGFLLEAHKIASPQAFDRMAQQFAGTADSAALQALRALWASEFGVAFGDPNPAPDRLEQGRELHRNACASCHSVPSSAFVSYPLARVLGPASGLLDAGHAEIWLLYVHLFACFLGLASLPFTRFFHVLAGPLSLLVNSAAPERALPARSASPGSRAACRALALDACVRCGICDAHCSVAPLARYLGNPGLLPAHKLLATGALASGRLLRPDHENQALQAAEGAFLCTDCGRCTSVCPVGLDLEDLWQAGRGDLAAAGLPAPAQWVQARTAVAWADSLEAEAGPQSYSDLYAASAPLSADRSSFSRCVQCQTCTNVCPVVAHSMGSEHGVDLTPQKVMNLLRLGLRELTLGSRMVWDCASCYQCQEHCPESVRVADIMCELRALAVRRLGAVRPTREAA